MRAYSLSFLAASVMLASGAAGCSRKEKSVRIAVAAPMTGDMGPVGQGLRRGVELAIEEANASGRLPFRVEAVPFDDRADPKEAVNVAHLIALDSRIVAVVGHLNSGCCLAAGEIYARAGMAMITPSATHPDVTLQQLREDWPGPRNIFRLVPTDDVQGAMAARFVFRKLRKRSVAVLHDGTTYGRDLAGEFMKVFVRLGGKVAIEETVETGRKDFKALLGKVRRAEPEAVYFAGLYGEAGLILRQMRELKMEQVFVSGDGAKTPGFFDVAGEAADGAYLSMVGVPVEVLPTAKDFLTKYQARWKARFQDVEPFDHFGYEAARIILNTLARTGSERKRLTEAIRSGKHRGMLGTVAFDEKGDTRSKIATMTRARCEGREFVVVR